MSTKINIMIRIRN